MDHVGITNRIKKIMDDNNLTPIQFSTKVGIQRSTLSHILSGRNLPSLSVIVKICSVFKDISYNWLIEGVNSVIEPIKSEVSTENIDNKEPSVKTISKSIESSKKKIDKIVFFYTDDSFKIYNCKS